MVEDIIKELTLVPLFCPSRHQEEEQPEEERHYPPVHWAQERARPAFFGFHDLRVLWKKKVTFSVCSRRAGFILDLVANKLNGSEEVLCVFTSTMEIELPSEAMPLCERGAHTGRPVPVPKQMKRVFLPGKKNSQRSEPG